MSDIANAFHEYFEIMIADTLELKKKCIVCATGLCV